MAEVESRGDSVFLHRATNIPLVKSTIEKVGEVYETTKGKNGLTQRTFGMAEQGARLAATMATPFLWTFQKPITIIDKVAEEKLANIEDSYPLIKMPTEEVVSEMKAQYSSSVAPVYERVKVVKQLTSDTVQKMQETRERVGTTAKRMKEAGRDTTLAVGQYGLDCARDALTSATDSGWGQMVLKGVNRGLGAAEVVLDTVVPSDTEREESEEESDEPASDLRSIVAGILDEEPKKLTLTASIDSAARLSSKLRRRLGARGERRLSEAQERSRDALQRMTSYVNLLEAARTQLQSSGTVLHAQLEAVSAQVSALWQRVQAEEQPRSESQDPDSFETLSIDARALLLGRRLVQQLHRAVSTTQRVMATVPALPEQTRNALSDAVQFADSSLKTLTGVESIASVPREFFTAARERLSQLQVALGDGTNALLNQLRVRDAYLLLGRSPPHEHVSPVEEQELQALLPADQSPSDKTDDSQVKSESSETSLSPGPVDQSFGSDL